MPREAEEASHWCRQKIGCLIQGLDGLYLVVQLTTGHARRVQGVHQNTGPLPALATARDQECGLTQSVLGLGLLELLTEWAD